MGFESAWLCPWSWTQYVPLSLEGGPLVVLGMQGGRPTHQVITWVAWEEEPLWHLLLLAMILFVYLFGCLLCWWPRGYQDEDISPRPSTGPGTECVHICRWTA